MAVLPLPPSISRLFYLPHITLVESLRLSVSSSIVPSLPHVLLSSLPLIISPTSHLLRSVGHYMQTRSCCQSHAHTEEIQHTETIITVFRRTRKLFHRLHFFTRIIFHGYFSAFVGTVLVVGIKTKTCRSLFSF